MAHLFLLASLCTASQAAAQICCSTDLPQYRSAAVPICRSTDLPQYRSAAVPIILPESILSVTIPRARSISIFLVYYKGKM